MLYSIILFLKLILAPIFIIIGLNLFLVTKRIGKSENTFEKLLKIIVLFLSVYYIIIGVKMLF